MDGDDATQRSRLRGLRNVVLPVVGTLLLGVGVSIQIWAASQPTSFGWFAYAPLSGAQFTPSASPNVWPWGMVLTSAGLVTLAFWAGLLVGRRRRDPATYGRS
jgi:heme/copper-type cytochrome/quinol oxidase subunit 1